MNIQTLTDAELVLAANEYFQRVINRMRNHGLDKQMTVMLYAGVHSKEYEISHDLHYGGYSNEIKLKGGNLFDHIDKHAIIAGMAVTPVVQVAPMLPAPTPIEDAHFVEVPY